MARRFYRIVSLCEGRLLDGRWCGAVDDSSARWGVEVKGDEPTAAQLAEVNAHALDPGIWHRHDDGSFGRWFVAGIEPELQEESG